jgi:Double zinc ribbon
MAAAVVLGAGIIWLVLQPLVWPARPKPAVYIPPEPEETRRGVALAALRDLELDRETGKLSDDDYAWLKARYTGEAVAALRAEDATGGESDIEQLIAARAKAMAGGPPACPICGPRPEADALFCSTCGTRLGSVDDCARCGAALPADGRYCELCGTAVAA